MRGRTGEGSSDSVRWRVIDFLLDLAGASTVYESRGASLPIGFVRCPALTVTASVRCSELLTDPGCYLW